MSGSEVRVRISRIKRSFTHLSVIVYSHMPFASRSYLMVAKKTLLLLYQIKRIVFKQSRVIRAYYRWFLSFAFLRLWRQRQDLETRRVRLRVELVVTVDTHDTCRSLFRARYVHFKTLVDGELGGYLCWWPGSHQAQARRMGWAGGFHRPKTGPAHH